MSNIKISIIVPVYNEEKTILEILKKLSDIKKTYENIEIIVINDGSIDSSNQILENNSNFYDSLLSYEKNKGKGNAVRNGLKVARGDYVTFQDADLEYDPKDLLKFFKVIDKFDPDLVIGSRLNYPEYTRSHNILNKFGNKILTTLFNLTYNTTFTDIYTCYVCFKKKLINFEDLKTNGFEQQAEILCKVVKTGDKFYEVPINYNGRNFSEGKKIKFYHIFGVIFQILKARFF